MSMPISEGFRETPPEIKPTWRGWIHTGVLPIVIAGGIVLIVLANGGPAKIASAVSSLAHSCYLATRPLPPLQLESKGKDHS